MTDSTPTVLTFSGDLSDDRLQELVLDLSQELRRSDIDVKDFTHRNVPGTRGDVITVGQIAIAFITTGAATALIECLRAYLLRDDSLIVDVEKPDGTKVSISAKNIDTKGIAQVIESIQRPVQAD